MDNFFRNTYEVNITLLSIIGKNSTKHLFMDQIIQLLNKAEKRINTNKASTSIEELAIKICI